MSEAPLDSRVTQIVMNYQQYLQSNIANSQPNRSQSPNGPSYSIHRKPPANHPQGPLTPNTPQAPGSRLGVRTPSLTSSAAPGPNSPVGPVTPNSVTSYPRNATSPSSVPAHTGTLTQNEVDAALRSCLAILSDAVTYHGKRPFSALLLAPDNSTVLLTHNSVSHVQHAESELARLATIQYSIKYLARCTLVSTWEPCAMCAGTIYWSGIGRVLYAASETTLKELTGPANNENMTMDMPCRTVLGAGQRNIEVIGPLTQWQDKVVNSSKPWWDEKRGLQNNLGGFNFGLGGGGGGGGNLTNSNNETLSTVVHDESVSSTVDDDGEYQADLKVDWMN